MVAPLIPLAIAGGSMIAGGVAGSLFGKKKVKPIDITAQLQQVKDSTMKQRTRVDDLYNQLQPLTGTYQKQSEDVISGARTGLEDERTRYLTENADLAGQAKNALRENLYSKTFSGLPDTLRAVREASAAGSGVDSGAYQQAVQNIGVDTSRSIAEGERDIQVEGLRGQQNAEQVAYQTFSQLSSKLDDQQLDLLTKVLDTGREDLVRRTSGQLGLDQAETQAIVDLLNFKASGQLASDSAEAANRQALYNALIGGGSGLIGKGIGGK